MTEVTALNQSLSQPLSLAEHVPFALMQPMPDPLLSPHDALPIRRFSAFVETISKQPVPEKDLEAFSDLMQLMAQIQSQYKDAFEHLTALKSIKGSKAAMLDQATETLSNLKTLQSTFDSACYKSGGKGLLGYAKRLFGNETWEQWASSRTELGQLVILASDYTQGGVSEASLSRKLKRFDLNQAMIEARTILSELQGLKDHDASDTVEPLESLKADARQLGATYEAASFLAAFGGSGNDYSYAIQETSNGSVVLSGYTNSFGVGNQDVLVAKLDDTGELLWAHALGGSSDDYGLTIRTTDDGGFVLSGYTTSFGAGNEDVLVAKLDDTGELLWAHALGGSSHEYGYAIQTTADGGLILSGYTGSFGAGNWDMLMAKLDDTGMLLWAHVLGGSNHEYGYAIQATADDGVILTGFTQSFGAGDDDVLLAKLNEAGELLWAHALGGSSDDRAYAIQATADGGTIFTGYTNSFGAGNDDVLLAKLDDAGGLLWAHTFGGAGYEYGHATQETTDGSFVLSGYSSSFGAGNHDVLVAKLDDAGELLWAHTLGGGNYEYGYAIQTTADGGFILSGYTTSFGAGNSDILVAKLNASGWSGNCSYIMDITGDITFTNITADIANEAITPDWLNITDSISVADAALVQTNITDSLQQEMVCFAEPVLDTTGAVTTAAPALETTLQPATIVQAAPNEAASFLAALGGSSYDYSKAISETADGGFILSGYTLSFGAGNYDVLVAKIDQAGKLLWAHALGGSSDDVSWAISETADGGFILSGRTQSFGAGSSDVLVAKMDQEGNLLWAHALGGSSDDRSYASSETADGGFILSSYTYSFGAGNTDVLVAKIDQEGSLLWAHALGGSGTDISYAISETADGGFILSGVTKSFGAGNNDVLVAKMDQEGSLLWAHALDGSSLDYGTAISETADGGFILSGYTYSFGAGDYDVLVAKIDQEGSLLWAHALGGSSDDRSYAISETADGGFILSGTTYSFGAGYEDILVAKIDQQGNLLWAHALGGSSNDRSDAISETADGGFILSGVTKSFGAGYSDVLVAKLNASGWAENCSHIIDITGDITFTNITADITYQAITPNWLNITDSVSYATAALIETNITTSLQQELTCQAPFVEEDMPTTAAPVATTMSAVMGAYSGFYRPANEMDPSRRMTADGGSLSFGKGINCDTGVDEIQVIKYGAEGAIAWAWGWELSMPDYDAIAAVKGTVDGGAVLLGRTGSFGAGDYDVLVTKLDEAGSLDWSWVIGSVGADIGHSIVDTYDGVLS